MTLLKFTLFHKINKHLQAPNIYHVKQEVSNITNRDFALGALEYRLNKLQQGIQELKTKSKETKPNSSIPTWLITFPITSLVLALLVWIGVWKKKH